MDDEIPTLDPRAAYLHEIVHLQHDGHRIGAIQGNERPIWPYAELILFHCGHVGLILYQPNLLRIRRLNAKALISLLLWRIPEPQQPVHVH